MSETHEGLCLVPGMYSGFGARDLENALHDPAYFYGVKKAPHRGLF
jgi:hypothetical protein